MMIPIQFNQQPSENGSDVRTKKDEKYNKLHIFTSVNYKIVVLFCQIFSESIKPLVIKLNLEDRSTIFRENYAFLCLIL